MAAYIDLNPVRSGIVEDPKDYRFCGYAEAVAGHKRAKQGLGLVWAAHADGSARTSASVAGALQAHRELIFGKRAADAGLPKMSRAHYRRSGESVYFSTFSLSCFTLLC